MKKLTQKLALNKQTVASLDHLRMGLVVGGQAESAVCPVQITYTKMTGCPTYGTVCNVSYSTSCIFCVPTKADSCVMCAVEEPKDR